MSVIETTPPNLHELVIDRKTIHDTFRDDVLNGLTAAEKSIPAKHLYDARGSQLFEQICELDEYYLTATEASIYDAHISDIAAAIGTGVTLIEPGAGSGEKAQRLLSALDSPRAFVPIEISSRAVVEAAERLARQLPEVSIHPICADFTREDDIPDEVEDGTRTVFFPGSTIGNFERSTRLDLLRRFSCIAGEGGVLLVGFDLIKDPDVLESAYDDSEGVTAEFNTNLLHRINGTLDAKIDPSLFSYEARWVSERSRVEMGQISQCDQDLVVCEHHVSFTRGERLHTENSHKFTIESFGEEASRAGFEPIERWTDPAQWYCVGLYRVA